MLAALDASLLGLDSRAGKLLWKTQMADYSQGYSVLYVFSLPEEGLK